MTTTKVSREPARPRDVCRACWYGAPSEDCPACRRLERIAARGFDHADDGASHLSVPRASPVAKCAAVLCYVCGNPAVCEGAEGNGPVKPSCGKCCGHGGGDGIHRWLTP